MVRFLTEEAGAGVDGVSSGGWTPTCEAAREGHLEVARILAEERERTQTRRTILV